MKSSPVFAPGRKNLIVGKHRFAAPDTLCNPFQASNCHPDTLSVAKLPCSPLHRLPIGTLLASTLASNAGNEGSSLHNILPCVLGLVRPRRCGRGHRTCHETNCKF